MEDKGKVPPFKWERSYLSSLHTHRHAETLGKGKLISGTFIDLHMRP